MQLKQIPRDALLKPLSAVSGIVERRHTLPILANVLLEQKNGQLHVTATDLEMQITAVADLAGKDGAATTVGARKLQDLLRALPDSAQINVDASGSKMTVRAGGSRFNLQTLSASDYPRINVAQDKLQSLSLPQRAFRSLLKLAEFAMAQQDIRYYLNGMLLVVDKATLQAVATDGHRLSWASVAIEGDYPRAEVILPRKTVLELSKLLEDSDTPVSIDILANQARFRFANVELVSKVVDGKFPDYNRVIPAGHGKRIELERATLLSALQRAAILSNEKFRGVRSRSSARTASRKRPRSSCRWPTRAKASTSASTSRICSTSCRTSAATRSTSHSATPIRVRSSLCPSATTTSTSSCPCASEWKATARTVCFVACSLAARRTCKDCLAASSGPPRARSVS